MVQVPIFTSQYFNTVLGWFAFPFGLELRSQGMVEWFLTPLYIYLGACTAPLGERLPPKHARYVLRYNHVILDIGSCLLIQANSLPFPRRPIPIISDSFLVIPLQHDDTSDKCHSHTRPYHVQVLIASCIPTHLPIASLTPLGHSHAHYPTNMGGCNPNDTTHVISHGYRPSWAQASVTTNCYSRGLTLTLLGPLPVFWCIPMPELMSNYI